MSKDAYYFSHDSNAKDDPRCMLLIDQLGLEGYGIFWVLIEILRDQPAYRYPLNLVPILARKHNTTAEKMKVVVLKYDLFQIDEDENFFSISLCRRMEKMSKTREQRKLAGRKSGESRRKKALEKGTGVQRAFNGCSTGVQRPLNKEKERKGKERKIKENKEENKEVEIEKQFHGNNEKSLDANLDFEKKKRVKKEKQFSPEHIAFVDSLIELFPERITAKYTKAKLDDLRDCVDKLVRIDGEAVETISDVTKWARKDGFWSVNFLSLSKLRKKDPNGISYFDVFREKMENQSMTNNNKVCVTKKETANPADYQQIDGW